MFFRGGDTNQMQNSFSFCFKEGKGNYNLSRTNMSACFVRNQALCFAFEITLHSLLSIDVE